MTPQEELETELDEFVADSEFNLWLRTAPALVQLVVEQATDAQIREARAILKVAKRDNPKGPHAYLLALNHDDWFGLVDEFATIRESASPALQRLIREELFPVIDRTNQQRKVLSSEQ